MWQGMNPEDTLNQHSKLRNAEKNKIRNKGIFTFSLQNWEVEQCTLVTASLFQ